jgi:hypothetical protein
MVADIVDDVLLHEDREEYIRLMLSRGASLDGLYPMGAETEKHFLEWRRGRGR